MQADEEHLNLLAVFHYVVAAITALFSCFALIYIGLGVAMILHPESMSGSHGEPPPAFMGWLFTSIGIAFLIASLDVRVLPVSGGPLPEAQAALRILPGHGRP